MSSNRLDLLIRKNKGKSLLNRYKDMFVLSGFSESELEHVGLEESDEQLNHIRNVFPEIREQVEILSESCTYLDSKLLMSAFVGSNNCYIFSDDVYYCGMYIANARSIQAHCLNVAKLGYSNTCFILDRDLKFSFTINFYNEDSMELKNKFDIQLKSLV